MSVPPTIPVVTGAQMAAVDRAMEATCGLQLLQVMEIAGRAVAIAVRHLRPAGSIVILCGSGGNGGDGLVSARYLAGWGYDVRCVLSRPAAEFRGLAAHQLDICTRLEIPMLDAAHPWDDVAPALIVDGLFGFGLTEAPQGAAARLIERVNASGFPILAIDLPSGLDATSGVASSPTVAAEVTLTLGLPKRGLLVHDGPQHAGTVVIADIGIPGKAYAAVGISTTPVFDSTEFVTLDGRHWPA